MFPIALQLAAIGQLPMVDHEARRKRNIEDALALSCDLRQLNRELVAKGKEPIPEPDGVASPILIARLNRALLQAHDRLAA